jgi:hypothetical protein
MMVSRRLKILFAILILSAFSFSSVQLKADEEEDLLHLVVYEGLDRGPASQAVTTERIRSAAEEHKKYAPVPRFATWDMAFAKDAEEFVQLDGYGIVIVSSLNQDPREHPIVQLYFQVRNGGRAPLQRIGAIEVGTEDPLIKRVFGTHRVDYYYLLPHNVTQQPGELLVDWSRNRKAFVLAKFPWGHRLDFLIDDQWRLPSKGKKISPAVLNDFMIREFSVKFDVDAPRKDGRESGSALELMRD